MRRLLLTTKQAALFLQVSVRQVRRGRDEGWLHPVGRAEKYPHGHLWDPYKLTDEWETRRGKDLT